MHFYILLILSYLSGSIPFGKIVGYLKGIDIQKEGSRNIGFANSLRVMGWKPALIVLIGDVLKGYIPVYFTLYKFNLDYTLVIGLATITGCIFMPWLKLKGGKGAATILGVSLALSPTIALIAMIVWVVIFLLYRTASVASLIIALIMPIFSFLLKPELTYFYLLLLIIILITHRVNILNLIKGNEPKIL